MRWRSNCPNHTPGTDPSKRPDTRGTFTSPRCQCSECCHTRPEAFREKHHYQQLIQAFRGNIRRTWQQSAAAADRSKLTNTPTRKPIRGTCQVPSRSWETSLATTNWVTGEAPGNAQSDKDESSAQHTPRHVIHELHARRSLQKTSRNSPTVRRERFQWQRRHTS